MHQLGLKFESDICSGCYSEPVFIKKRGLGHKCYRKWNKQNRHYSTPLNSEAKVNRLKKKYGPEIINDIGLLATKPFWNLKDLGDKYDFSREYARQLFQFFYGESYSRIKKSKTEKVNNDEIGCSLDPRAKLAEAPRGTPIYKAAIAEVEFFNRCQSMDFDWQLTEDKRIDCKVNDFFIGIKSSFKARKYGSGTKYYHFNISKYQIENCHFIACFIARIRKSNKFYIIPTIFIKQNTKRKNRIVLYIRKGPKKIVNYPSKHNNYIQFREAWHLLKR